jgi:hypothetical protein
VGRSPRSSRRSGKLATGRRRTAYSQSWDWKVGRSSVNTDAPWPDATMARQRVLTIQTKLHQWATDDPGRRFDDLGNLVYDPAVLVEAWHRVRRNRGARTAWRRWRDGLLRHDRPRRAGLRLRVARRTQDAEVPTASRTGGDDSETRLHQAPPFRHRRDRFILPLLQVLSGIRGSGDASPQPAFGKLLQPRE